MKRNISLMILCIVLFSLAVNAVSRDIVLNINKDYYNVHDNFVSTLIVYNQGDSENEFRLSAVITSDNEDFPAKPTFEKLIIEPHSSKTIELFNFEIDESFIEDNYTLLVELADLNANFLGNENISFGVYDPTLQVESEIFQSEVGDSGQKNLELVYWIILFIVLGAFIMFYVFHKQRDTEIAPLEKYIKKAISRGFRPFEIKRHLKKFNWREHDIDEAFENLKIKSK